MTEEKEVLGWIERSNINTLTKRLRKAATDGDAEKVHALSEEIENLNLLAKRLEYMLGE